MPRKPLGIALNAAPIIIMIALITLVQDDILLAALYAAIIIALLAVRNERADLIAFFFGLFIMTFFEWLFVNTGVEVFSRDSLFGVMPLWLPVLWGYGFVAIRRSVTLISEQ